VVDARRLWAAGLSSRHGRAWAVRGQAVPEPPGGGAL